MNTSSNIDAGKLPEAVRAWLGEVNRLNDELRRAGHQRTVAEAREALAAITQHFVTRPSEVACVQDERFAGAQGPIPLRLYHPQPDRALPVILFAHGGGHVAGSVEVYDPLARRLANATQHLVVAVDYRLAPEYPYPAGLNDVIEVAKGLAVMLRTSGLAHVPRFALVRCVQHSRICCSPTRMCRLTARC